MGLLYLLSKGSTARKDSSRIVIEKEGTVVNKVPIRALDAIVIGKAAHITTEVLFLCIREKVPVFFVDHMGHILSQMVDERQSLQALEYQLQCFGDENVALRLARVVVTEKINNQFQLLKRYEKSVKNPELPKLLEKLKILAKKADAAVSIDEIRGYEGNAAKVYFEGFPMLLDKRVWPWHGRNRKPAQDPTNALLNFGYAFLERDVRMALMENHLDARIGFLHSSDGRKDSFVYDMMELFRQPVIDRFVLQLLRRKSVKPDGFKTTKADGCRLTDETRRDWCFRYEAYMEKVYQEYQGRSVREQISFRVGKFRRQIEEEI